MEITMIKTKMIKPSKDNRKAEEDIGYLASVGRVGIINPIQVTRFRNGYRVVAGNRRLASAVRFGLEEVPCVIMGAKESVSVQAAENFDRKPLNPLDEADMIVKLRDDGVADPVIQDWLHISQRDFNRRLLLLDLCDEAKDDLRNGTLCMGSALELATIKDPLDQSEAYKSFHDDEKLNHREAKSAVERTVKYLGYCPQGFLEYVASDGRACTKCRYASGCSDDYSLFPEGGRKYCHDAGCFRNRLDEYREVRRLSATPPPNCVQVYSNEYDGHEDDFIQVIDDDGWCRYYREKSETEANDGVPGSSDKTLPSRKAHNKAMKTLNPILTEIARLTVEKLKVRYVSLCRDELAYLPMERDLTDRMAAYVCSELYHESALTMGKLIGYEGDFPERLRHVWAGVYGTNPYRSDPKEPTPDELDESYAWASLIVRCGKSGWDGAYLSKAVAGGGYPRIIRQDNWLVLLARDVVPEWDVCDLHGKWFKAWEDYVCEQKSLGNPNTKGFCD